eukprot:TRINITY_DN25931_c0_g1_i1.p1 TRINITY_DN25931_c0_g1~~TRINITY_DN25931_c0_g1_i1.p1  ORF type:complete len:960 (-),score=183.22 TRINITY_DN25931_c0_g1_i1:148-2940(-)
MAAGDDKHAVPHGAADGVPSELQEQACVRTSSRTSKPASPSSHEGIAQPGRLESPRHSSHTAAGLRPAELAQELQEKVVSHLAQLQMQSGAGKNASSKDSQEQAVLSPADDQFRRQSEPMQQPQQVQGRPQHLQRQSMPTWPLQAPQHHLKPPDTAVPSLQPQPQGVRPPLQLQIPVSSPRAGSPNRGGQRVSFNLRPAEPESPVAARHTELLEGIDRQLRDLRSMPASLGTILDSLTQLQEQVMNLNLSGGSWESLEVEPSLSGSRRSSFVPTRSSRSLSVCSRLSSPAVLGSGSRGSFAANVSSKLNVPDLADSVARRSVVAGLNKAYAGRRSAFPEPSSLLDSHSQRWSRRPSIMSAASRFSCVIPEEVASSCAASVITSTDFVVDGCWSLGGPLTSGRSENSQRCTRTLTEYELCRARGTAPQCIILPCDPMRLLWDLSIVLITLFIAILVPFGMAYKDHNAFVEGFLADCNTICTAFFAVDLLLNFRTAYWDRGRLVFQSSRVAAHYARTWLVVDVLAACPMMLLPKDSQFVWTIPVFKLARVLRLAPLMTSLQKEFRSLHFMSLKILINVFIACHVMTCIWGAMQGQKREAEPGPMSAEAQMNNWDRYVRDMYWVQMTMTTVGFGDIVPQATHDRLFAIAVMLVAPMFFGGIVSFVTQVTKGVFNDESDMQVAQAAKFMHSRKVPKELQRRVENNLRRFITNEHQVSNAPNLLAKLSPGVQRELSVMLLAETILQFPLFKAAPHSFISDLAQAHSWLHCLSGEFIVEEGQLQQELVFVVKGRLLALREGFMSQVDSIDTTTNSLYCQPSDFEALPDMDVWRVHAGAWFGEACLFDSGCLHSKTVVADTDVELAVLPAREYQRTLRKYPALLTRHSALSDQLSKGTLSLKELSYKSSQTDQNGNDSPASRTSLLKTLLPLQQWLW